MPRVRGKKLLNPGSLAQGRGWLLGGGGEKKKKKKIGGEKKARGGSQAAELARIVRTAASTFRSLGLLMTIFSFSADRITLGKSKIRRSSEKG